MHFYIIVFSISFISLIDLLVISLMKSKEHFFLSIDVIVLTGGHVPTQNNFLKQLRLRERLLNYNGIIVAWSAGSMNCADVVYAGPEFEGEAIDPLYERWISGLGITDINIFPHFQKLKDDKEGYFAPYDETHMMMLSFDGGKVCREVVGK